MLVHMQTFLPKCTTEQLDFGFRAHTRLERARVIASLVNVQKDWQCVVLVFLD